MNAITTPLFKVHMPGEVFPRVQKTLASGRIAAGAEVAQFEEAVAAFSGNPHTVAVRDISAALTLALYAAGVRPGDEVVVSPMSCLATAMPIANLFARPVWCDVDAATGMPTVDMLRSSISARTRALMLYHWSGDVGDVEGALALAREHGLPLIEDASEAFGADAGDQRLGSHGVDFTAYSFGPVRHISCGEGAALCLGAAGAAERLRRLRRYGIDGASFRLANGDLNPASDIPEAGFHFGLDNLAASIGLAQWHWAERNVHAHRDNGRYYETALWNLPGVRLLARRSDANSAYWTYALRAGRRDALIAKLHAAGIGAQRLHLRLDRYSCFAGSADKELPGVDVFDAENLSIPCGWWVTRAERERIAGLIRSGW
jgi:dTDP-4-amino-4,6-dideoxygalactose transaminase